MATDDPSETNGSRKVHFEDINEENNEPCGKELSGVFETAMKYAQKFKNSANYNSKMAALNILSRVQLSDLRIEESEQLIHTIGFSYIQQLLRSKSTEEVPAEDLQAVGAAVLAWMCSVESICSTKDFLGCCSCLVVPLSSHDPPFSDNTSYQCRKSLLNDLFCYLLVVVSSHEGRVVLADSDVVHVLVQRVADRSLEHEKASQILMALFCGEPDLSTQELSGEVWLLIEALTFDCDSVTTETLKTLELVGSLLGLLDPVEDISRSETVLTNVRTVLIKLIKSKLCPKDKQTCLLCVAQLVRLGRPDWLMQGNTDGQNLLLFVGHSCSIEVELALEDRQLSQVVNDENQLVLVLACFSALEEIVKMVVVEEQVEIAGKITGRLHRIAECLVQFLLNCATNVEDTPSHPFIVACIKVLGLLITMETSLEVVNIDKLLPFFGQIIVNNSVVLEFLLPFFVDYSTTSEGMENLKKNGLVRCMAAHYNTLLTKIRGDHMTSSDEDHLMSVVNVYLNYALLCPDLKSSACGEQDVFQEMLHNICSNVTWFMTKLGSRSGEDFVLTLVLLGLGLLRHFGGTGDFKEEDCSLLVMNSARLLMECGDVPETWQLCAQLLADCATHQSWIAQLLVRSGLCDQMKIHVRKNSKNRQIVDSLTPLMQLSTSQT